MTASSGPAASSELSQRYRVAFWLACAWAVATMWLAPHLPQVDLPQHAAQVALLREMFEGRSVWDEQLRVNLLTPYLIGYLSLYALSLVMSIEAAIALLYSLAFLAFVAACISLRRQLRADPRLDWLCLPVFFGLSWRWGFLTFLLAVPIGLFYLRECYRFVQALRARDAALLVLLGVALLFSHGLVFLYAVGLGLLVALASEQPGRRRLFAALPGVLLLAGFALYKILVLDPEMQQAVGSEQWYFGSLKVRLLAITTYATSATHHEFYPAPLITLVAAAAPWALGLRLQRGLAPKLPFLCTLAMMLVLPSFLFGATHFYERFAFLLPPTYALMFARADAPAAPRPAWRSEGVVMALLALCAASVFARETWRNLVFADESRSAWTVLDRIPERQLVLWLPLDRDSPRAKLRDAYLHYALWYQAHHGGLVEFNFATLLPQVVRFRDIHRHIPPIFSWELEDFRWDDYADRGFGYVVVRSYEPPDPAAFASQRCPLQLVASDGPWRLYRNPCGIVPGAAMTPAH